MRRFQPRKVFEKPLHGDMTIRRQDIVHLVGEVLFKAGLGGKEHVEDRVNKRLRSSTTRTRKVNQLAAEECGKDRYKVAKVAVWAAREWPTLDFSTAFASFEPANATLNGTLGMVSLTATLRTVPVDYESCKAALIEAWARIDQLERERVTTPSA